MEFVVRPIGTESVIVVDVRFGDAPVVDLKPAMVEFSPTDGRQPEWVGRLMADHFRP